MNDSQPSTSAGLKPFDTMSFLKSAMTGWTAFTHLALSASVRGMSFPPCLRKKFLAFDIYIVKADGVFLNELLTYVGEYLLLFRGKGIPFRLVHYYVKGIDAADFPRIRVVLQQLAGLEAFICFHGHVGPVHYAPPERLVQVGRLDAASAPRRGPSLCRRSCPVPLIFIPLSSSRLFTGLFTVWITLSGLVVNMMGW